MFSWPLLLALGAVLGSISQGMTDIRSRARQGLVGDWVYSDPTKRSGGGLNAYPQAKKIVTVTVANIGDDLDVIITINSTDVTFNTGDTPSLDAAGIAAGLAEAINADGFVRANVEASSSGGTLTLTGINPGIDFTVSIASDPNAALSSVTVTQAAATASAVPFGRAVVWNAWNAGGPSQPIGETERLVMAPLAGAFTAQVITATVPFVNTAVITVRVYEVRGDERVLLASVNEASATSADATIDALVALLNGVLPANTVLVAADNATATALVFTSEVPGREIDVEVVSGSEGASVPAISVAYTTGPNPSTSLIRAWEGVSLYNRSMEAPTLTSEAGEYGPNVGVHYAIRGCVWVQSDEAVSRGGTVYVETVAGATCGRFYAAGSATRVALPRRIARWERDGLVGSDSLAALRLEA